MSDESDKKMEEFILKYENENEKNMGWIKLSDNRPPYGKYLVLYRNSSKEYNHSVVTFCGVTRGIYSDELIDTWYVTPGGGAQLYEPEISYWMPLPEPPTGE